MTTSDSNFYTFKIMHVHNLAAIAKSTWQPLGLYNDLSFVQNVKKPAQPQLYIFIVGISRY